MADPERVSINGETGTGVGKRYDSGATGSSTATAVTGFEVGGPGERDPLLDGSQSLLRTNTTYNREQYGFEFAGWGSSTIVSDIDEELLHGPNMRGEVRTIGADDFERAAASANSSGGGDGGGGGGGGGSETGLDRQYATRHIDSAVEHKLGQIASTAICGNDITSSCLYVAGLAAVSAGRYTPISLAIVAGMLYLFRSVYSEALSALPLNGGSYTVLLNTTSKSVASLAACLTMLSYAATAVVSGATGMAYLQQLYEDLPIEWAVVGLLALFMVLNLIGITESAVAAVFIFTVHMLTLFTLIVVCTIAFCSNPKIFLDNWREPDDKSVFSQIFFGFCTALLGISGFETSANFIEQQKSGVFPKTLRNMWVAVSFLNPVISLLSWGVLTSTEITESPDDLLISMANKAPLGGEWLRYAVGIDATLVLSGAVLTSYVGVTGLVRRMALDRCLPQFLLRENSLRRTNHYIIIGFFLICSSLYLIVRGDVSTLAGVYTIAFLSVMALFAIGNMLLKYKRSTIRRDSYAPWPSVIVALIGVTAGLFGNIALNVHNFELFLIYFVATVAIVWLMFTRVRVMKFVLYFARKMAQDKRCRCCAKCKPRIEKSISEINSQAVVFFCHKADLPTINKAILYARDNELTSVIHVVHVYDHEENIPEGLEEAVLLLDRVYPKQKIDLFLVKGDSFNPIIIDQISRYLNVAKNYCFIATPSETFPYNLDQLGGVRLITH